MKKMGSLGVLSLCCLLLLAGCVQNQGQEQATLSCQEILAALQESQAFTDEMKEMAQAQLLRYLAIEEDQIADAAMSMDASRETPEAIVVLTAASTDQVQPLEEALSLYLSDTIEQYRDYRPLEMPKLENAVLRISGTRLALVIGPDAQAAGKVLDEKLGQ